MYICDKYGVCLCVYVGICRSGTRLCVYEYVYEWCVCVCVHMCMWSVYSGTLYISEMKLSALGHKSGLPSFF